MKYLIPLICLISAVCPGLADDYVRYVDPMIGSEGLGRVFVGPSMPYGMVKPGPDCVSMPNSGWAPMPEPVKGFSQVHVSGTGGGQKYGNVLLMPYAGPIDEARKPAGRVAERAAAGYYATKLDNDINVEIAAADRAAIYRIVYPSDCDAGLVVDAGSFLGMSDIPDQRETQQLVGSQIEIVSDTELRGYNRVRGGWNDGRAYTVYFYMVIDKPFSAKTWKDDIVSDKQWQSDTHRPTGALLDFGMDCDTLNVRVGISYLSELKALENLLADIPEPDFDATLMASHEAWNDLLSRIEIDPQSTDEQKRMFYTALYHTMIMPTDRRGECPLWSDDEEYYDDYYAIWDTYRTSMPLITLIDPGRQVSMVNSLLNIYRRDGYMPDARSGNSNGRTQGGSNAEIAIADAFVKGLDGIDYELALEAMLKDADVPPGGKEEAEGRGGLVMYNALGYVPYPVARAGNRTVEYAFCDYAIAKVAQGLGRDDVRERFARQSSNWKNLWRADYEHAGVKGFIMPRDEHGVWLDSLQQGHSDVYRPKYAYTANTFEGPWYTPWWSMFFYEAPSWEYSLSIPHDVPGLIEMCGGHEAMRNRLDIFFDQGFYNVNNEPSFLTPCLYHWLGRPDLSSDRVREIVMANFNDSGMGLPGNDDSGAMSSWLAFHMIGLYPNAGHDYYLIHSPLVKSAVLRLAGNKTFTIKANGLSDKNRYVVGAKLNGADYPYSSITHADIVAGGVLELSMGSRPKGWGAEMAPQSPTPDICRAAKPTHECVARPEHPDSLMFVFKLHGQTRRYRFGFAEMPDGGLELAWGIERNLKWQSGTFVITPEARRDAEFLDFTMPLDGEHVKLPGNTTAYMLSQRQLSQLKNTSSMRCNKGVFDKVGEKDGVIHAFNRVDGCEIWVLDDDRLPLVVKMSGNNLEVNWTVR